MAASFSSSDIVSLMMVDAFIAESPFFYFVMLWCVSFLIFYAVCHTYTPTSCFLAKPKPDFRGPLMLSVLFTLTVDCSAVCRGFMCR